MLPFSNRENRSDKYALTFRVHEYTNDLRFGKFDFDKNKKFEELILEGMEVEILPELFFNFLKVGCHQARNLICLLITDALQKIMCPRSHIEIIFNCFTDEDIRRYDDIKSNLKELAKNRLPSKDRPTLLSISVICLRLRRWKRSRINFTGRRSNIGLNKFKNHFSEQISGLRGMQRQCLFEYF